MQVSDNIGYLNIITEISKFLSNVDEREEVESYRISITFTCAYLPEANT